MYRILLLMIIASLPLSSAYSQKAADGAVNYKTIVQNSPRTIEKAAAKQAQKKEELAAGERLMGYYDTDDLPQSIYDYWAGTGLVYYPGDYYAANIFDTDVTEDFVRGKITGIRFALANNLVQIHSAFVCEFPADINQVIGYDPLSEVDLSSNFTPQQGWNTVYLDTPVEIKSDKWYAVGFEYTQEGTIYDTVAFPLVTDADIATDYPSKYGWWTYGDVMEEYGTDWYYWGYDYLDSNESLCLQAIVESDNFPDYDIRLRKLTVDSYVTGNGELNYSFQMRNYGNLAVSSYSVSIEIDGNVVATLDNPAELTFAYQTYSGSIALPEGFDTSSASHTFKAYVSSVNGADPEEGTSSDVLEATFSYYEAVASRQMHLVEQYTSVRCGYCPLGHDTLEKLLEDNPGKYAWVAIHSPQMGTDPYVAEDAIYLDYYFGAYSSIGYPSGVFDRIYLDDPDINDNGTIPVSLGWQSIYQSVAAEVINEAVDAAYEAIPAFVSVDIDASYDKETRQLDITVSGEGVATAQELLAGNVLTVYLTEDGISGTQEDYTNGNEADGYFIDYVHDNVLRQIVTPYYGDEINWSSGSSFSNTYSVTLADDMVAANMNVIAFVSGPIVVFNDNGTASNAPASGAYVNNANKIKLSETSGISSVSSTEGTKEAERYSVNGVKLSAPVKGVNIIKMSDGSVKKVIVK